MVHRFRASRWSAGNRLFPTVLEVTDRHVALIKPSLAGRTEESIGIRQVSSVTVSKRALWAEIVVHSSGGVDPLRSIGHPHADADRLKHIIEEYQTNIARTGVADTSDLRSCPRCAELVKAAAQVCRFCGGTLPIELTDEVVDEGEDDLPSKEWSWS